MYIIASSKPWHYDACLSSGLFNGDEFRWVSNRDELKEAIEHAKNIRYIFFLHWNWLVPETVWKKYECVCFHMTDVPYGRGGSPLQNLILRGHTATQLTALRMVSEMDAGPVYTKRPLSLEGPAHEIYMRAGKISYEIMQWMIDHEPNSREQEGNPVIFERRKPEQSQLPDSASMADLYDYIRMLDAPTYPHAFIEYGGFILEFKDAAIDGEELTATVRFHKKLGGL